MVAIDPQFLRGPKWDTDQDVDRMQEIAWTPLGGPQVKPRVEWYDSPEAEDIGLRSMRSVLEEKPDIILSYDQLKNAIEHAHAKKLMPMYHQNRTWAPVDSYIFDQDGWGYCWAFSLIAAFMDCMALEDRDDFAVCAPFSMSWLVGHKNKGNYLSSGIRGLRERGVCPVPNGGSTNDIHVGSYWDPYDHLRARYRLEEIWDIDVRQGDRFTMQQVVTSLCLGFPIYGAWNWWGHAVEIVGVLWTPGEYLDMTLLLRNSHRERYLRKLSGQRMVPDEGYPFRSTKRYVESREGSGLYVPATAV